MRQRRNIWQALLAAGIISLALGVALPYSAIAQSDKYLPQPEKDAAGRPIPNHFTLSICKGTHYDMTPKNGKRDRYTTPHGITVTNNTDKTKATGGEHGENGTIRINSGAPGLPGTTGETTISYDIIDRGTGQAVEHVTVKVKVIDCNRLTTPTAKKVVIGAGAVAAGTAVAVAAGGSPPKSTPVAAAPTTPTTPATSSTTTTTTIATTSSTTTTTIAPINISGLLGTYNIQANKIADTGCNFQAGFVGQLQLSGNSDGSNLTTRMVERLTRTYLGSMQQNGSFNGTGNGNLDGFIYSGTIAGQVSGNTVTGTEIMNFSGGCPGRQVTYNFTGSK